MIRKSPYSHGSTGSGVKKQTPSITRLMGEYDQPKTPQLAGTHNAQNPRSSRERKPDRERTP